MRPRALVSQTGAVESQEDRLGVNGYALGLVALNGLAEQGKRVFTQGDKVLLNGCQCGGKVSVQRQGHQSR